MEPNGLVIVSLETMMVQMGWSFTRIDQETQDGTIELWRKGGRTGYRLHKQFAGKPVVKSPGMNVAEVGRFVNRKA